MVDLRKWSDGWALKLKKNPDNFFKKVEGLNDIMKTSNEDLAKALDVPVERVMYMKRGLQKFGKPRGRKVLDFTSGIPIKAVEKMYSDYQKLLQREVKLDEEKTHIEKEKERYKPLAHAFKALQEAASRVVKDEEKAASAGR